MAKYRKKSMVIEARLVPTDDSLITRYLHESIELAEWCDGVCHMMNQDDENGGPRIDIRTSEGIMAARPGDYIICGVKGEFYPCKPDIFKATYDLVEEK